MPVGAAIGSALIGAASSRSAAKSQERAANDQIAVQRETRDMIREDLSGYREAGDLGRDAYLYNLGLGPRPLIGGMAPQIETFTEQGPGTTESRGGSENPMQVGVPGATMTRYRVNGQVFDTMDAAQSFANQNMTGAQEYAGFQATPGYQFQFDQGMAGVNALAGARGGLNSGRTMQDLMRTGQGLANQEFGNYLNRLGGLADTGLNAAAMQGTASSNAAAGMSNALANRGNAQAAGAIGFGNALQGGISNGLGILNYQRQVAGGSGGTGSFGLPMPFG